MTTIEFKAKAIRTEADAVEFLKSIERFDSLNITADNKVRIAQPCGRCGGSGNGGWFQDGGVCYECGGVDTRNRHVTYTIKAYAQKTKRKLNAAEKAAKAYRERAIEIEAKKIEGQRNWCESQGHGRITFVELDEKRKAAREATKGLSNHVGTVKERADFELTLLGSPSWEGSFGLTFCHLFMDADGNKLIWKTGNSLGMDTFVNYADESDDLIEVPEGTEGSWPQWLRVEKGQKIVLKATIKEHGEREGEKQTVLTRAKLLRLVG